MGDDTCSVILRIFHKDSAAVTRAFRAEPDTTETLEDDGSGLLRLLVYEETTPDPLSQLIEERVAFDGRCSNRFHSPGQLFASLDGEFRAIDHPYCVVTVPIDLATMSIDQDALAALRAYRELAARVDTHFQALTRGCLPEDAGRPARSSAHHSGERLFTEDLTWPTACQAPVHPAQHAEKPARRGGGPPHRSQRGDAMSDPVADLNQALGLARHARSLLRRARAPRSHRKAVRLCSSIAGAIRHALRMPYRQPSVSDHTPAGDGRA